jgi:HSP20 family protein
MAKTKPSEAGAAGHTPEPQTYEHEGGQAGTQRQQQGGAGGQADRLQGSQGTEQGQQVQVGQGEGQGRTMQERQGRGMARYGRDPFSMMQRLSEEMDELFDSFFYGRPLGRRQSQLPSLWSPEVEVCEEGNQLRICVDLPGVSKDNIKVDLHEGVLTIQGERREERSEGGEQQGFRRSERRYGSFYRSIPLPEGADAEQAQAQMKDGVLEITFPMTPPKQAKRLQIQ